MKCDLEKYKEKYRTKSMRMPYWDYSNFGAYFITICVKDMRCVFGDIVNDKMQFSSLGYVVAESMQKIDSIHDFVVLDEWIVMPNHVHVILFINNSLVARRWCVCTRQFGELPKKSIFALVNHFKGVVKKWANKNGCENFVWQKKYYDRILRNERELDRVRTYIRNNPQRWGLDRNNKIIS